MKKSAVIILIIIFILSLNGCGVIPAASPPATNTTPPPAANTPTPPPPVSGVTKENIAQCVDFAVESGRIYYLNSFDQGHLYSVNTDGTDNRKLSNDGIMQFCVSDDRIYYENDSDGGKMFVMNTDGSNSHRLSDDRVSTVFWSVEGGKIYYNGGDDYHFYRMNTDGSGKMELSHEKPLYAAITGGRIYYLPKLGMVNGIYSITTDGINLLKLSDDNPYGITAYKDWLYYVNTSDLNTLYAMKTDGSGRHKLSDDYALNINIAGDRIYYINAKNEPSPICSMKLDGSGRKQLSSDNVNRFAVWNGRIYYMLTGTNIYSMSLDGSDRQLVLKVDEGAYKDVSYEVDESLREGMPKYRFVASGRVQKGSESAGCIMGLTGFDENGKSILSADFSRTTDDQVTGNFVFNEMMDTMGLHVVDVNFDGYKDVIILNDFSGAHGNTWYDCWLWDPKTASFVKSDSFSDICNPALDPGKKCIYSTGGSGAAFWGGSIYQFLNGKFVKTNDLDTYENGLTETKLTDGQMKAVRQVTYSEGHKGTGQSDAQKKYYHDSPLWQLGNPHWYWGGGHRADQWLGG